MSPFFVISCKVLVF